MSMNIKDHTIIKLEGVGKSYDRQVLGSVSLTVAQGERIAVTGASGSGKTTLLRLISGLEKPDCGVIEVSGRISYAFQEPRLFDTFSLIDNVACVSGRERALSMLMAVGLSNDAGKKPPELSGGMRGRVSLARALACEYDILLLDEAFKELDEELKNRMISLVNSESAGKTLIVVTHDPHISKSLGCSRYFDITAV